MPHLRSAICYLLPLAAYWLVLIYNLGAQWSVYKQYNYGWAVPFLCLYLIWRKISPASPPLVPNGIPAAPTSNLQPLISPPSHLPSSTFYLLVALWALLYAPTRFLHEANPIWRLTSVLLALEIIGLTLLLLRTTDRAPRVTPHASVFTFDVSRFTFPICFFLVAVPWPSGLESFLTQSLTRLNTSITVELLGMFRIPAVQHGSTIELSTGVLGIDEACSGLRSLQATLMISFFFGELYALQTWRRVLCVVAGFAYALAFNLGRTLLLSRVGAGKGLAAVAAWHDPVGVTILVGCFLCLWLVAFGFQRSEGGGQRAEDRDQTKEVGVPKSMVPPAGPKPEAPSVRQRSVISASVVSCALLAWLIAVEAGTEFWYRSHERRSFDRAEWSVHRPAQNATYREEKIPSSVVEQFRFDEGTQVQWQDGRGNGWELYYFRWFPAPSLGKRVAIQLAKTHGPEKCLPALGMKQSAYLGIVTVPVAGIELAMQQYLFDADGESIHVFYGIYEDPTGSAKLANRRKDFRSRLAAALTGSRNFGQRLLELAVVGYEGPEQARAALAHELQTLIRVRNTSAL